MPKPGINDYYYIGLYNYYLDQFGQADSAFVQYIELNPNITGYSFRARIAKKLDPDYLEWKALPFYQKIIELGEKDKEKNKKSLIEAYNYLGSNTYNVAKDSVKAKEYFQKSLEMDPADAFAIDMMTNIK